LSLGFLGVLRSLPRPLRLFFVFSLGAGSGSWPFFLFFPPENPPPPLFFLVFTKEEVSRPVPTLAPKRSVFSHSFPPGWGDLFPAPPFRPSSPKLLVNQDGSPKPSGAPPSTPYGASSFSQWWPPTAGASSPTPTLANCPGRPFPSLFFPRGAVCGPGSRPKTLFFVFFLPPPLFTPLAGVAPRPLREGPPGNPVFPSGPPPSPPAPRGNPSFGSPNPQHPFRSRLFLPRTTTERKKKKK